MVQDEIVMGGRDGGMPQQRILQAAGRRYSLRLEAGYWQTLETIAARRRIRLNRLVAEIAAGAGGANLASHLRVFCLEELRGMTLSRELAAEHTSVLALVQSAPTPALAADAEQRIVAANAPFTEWLGLAPEQVVGTPLLRHFRFRCRPGLAVDALWAELGGTWITAESARMIHIAPGRVLAANARLVPVSATGGRPLCLVWIVK
ncbi:MAG: ribbon-helix-helix domain-containing protein [Alphaproteobacteria bacterium]|nr:ribbon-helix-helix domain-containing protein [Alphaproteobacteria bacterium]